MKYNQKLPKKVEAQLDAYIERIKAIQWFKVSPDINREDVDTQVSVALKAFGVEASIEYRSLKSAEDWDVARDAAWDAARDAAWGAARDAAWDAAWDAARDAACDAARDVARDAAWDAAWDAARDAARGAARDAAWDAARDAAWDAAWDAARDAARGASDVLALNLDDYKAKYPNGNFINLIPLWEAGLYPCGVIDGKFVVYVPEKEREISQLTGSVSEVITASENYAVVNGKRYKLVEE